MKMPPIDMIGAVISMVQVSCTSSWICWTSLVVLVSSDAAPNRAVSSAENPVTWWKIADRRSRPNPMPARDPKYTAPTAQSTCSAVTAEHHAAQLDDDSQIALGDAVVDDRRVDRRQVQRSQRADHLEQRHDREQPPIWPRILSQQRPATSELLSHTALSVRHRLYHLRIAINKQVNRHVGG